MVPTSSPSVMMASVVNLHSLSSGRLASSLSFGLSSRLAVCLLPGSTGLVRSSQNLSCCGARTTVRLLTRRVESLRSCTGCFALCRFSTIELMATHPTEPTELYTTLLNTGLDDLDTAGCLQLIGTLTDLSDDLGKPDGARKALELSDQLEATAPSETDAAVLEYFRANAWSVLQRSETTNIWDWEHPALGKQIFHLRKCVSHPGFPKLEKLRRCQVFTNLGNCMDTVGRFVEAQEYWGQALVLEPR